MLTQKFVVEEYKKELNPDIKWAREYNNKCLRNIEGVNYKNHLQKINNYENDAQYKARDKLSISNKFLSEELLRHVDNAFNAKGGSKNYKFKTKQEENQKLLVEKLSNLVKGYSLSEYIENEWYNKYLVDPNGLIFQEESKNGDDRKTYPTYKSIQKIRSYEQNGLFVDWVIFEPHKENILIEGEKEIKVELFYAVDEKYYYIYQIKNKELYLKETIKHSFDKVPAILCSDLVDNVTGMRISPIDAQIELMDRFLVSNSVLSISEFFHNYPIPWRYTDSCTQCNGTGKVQSYEISRGLTSTECKSCEGTGKETKKDVTDVQEMRIPRKDEHKLDPPAGYIYMPSEPWELMTKSVDRAKDIIVFSHWGTTISKDSKNETATGRFLDAQPVNNRLNQYSKSIEKAHTSLANFIGEYYFPETFEKAFIQYGRRYLIETPDQIWEKYIKAKQQKAPDSTLDLLLFQFLESEYKENEQMFLYEKKKVILEPFVHQDRELIRSSAYISLFDKQKKEYFNEWCKTKTINEIVATDIKKLENQLNEFINQKIEKNDSIKNKENVS